MILGQIHRHFPAFHPGGGSIAKRHIRNLYRIAGKRELSITVDAFRRGINTIPADGVNKEYTELSDVPCDYDAIFITNPTGQHLDTLKQFHNKGKNFFIEKPVVSLTQLDLFWPPKKISEIIPFMNQVDTYTAAHIFMRAVRHPVILPRTPIGKIKVRYLLQGEEINFSEGRDDYQIRELEYFLISKITILTAGTSPLETTINRAAIINTQ